MRRRSRGIPNCGGGSITVAPAADDEFVFPNPSRRTPDHPPYSEMVSVALQALAEENGSTESSISAYIQSTFNDLPWGHDRLLPYYLRKLVAGGELTSPTPDRYQLSFHLPPSVSLPVRRRGRPRLDHSNPNPDPDPDPDPDPGYNPRFSPLPSAASRQQGRARMHRRRGRPPKIHSDITPLQLDQGMPLLRRGRGRGRVRGTSLRGRGDYVGRMAMRRLSLALPRSRGLKRRQGSFLASNNEELNCQFGNWALNGGSECGVLMDSENIERYHAGLEQGRPFVSPEQSEVGKGQFLGEDTTLSILEPGIMVPLLGSEHHEHGEGQMLQGEEPPFLVPEKTEFSQDQSLLGEKLPLLAPAQGALPPFLASERFELDQGQSMEEVLPPFLSPERTELGQAREKAPFLTSEQAKVLPSLPPEFLEHGQGQQRQGKTLPRMLHEQTELVQKQPSKEPSLLSSEQPEHDHVLPLKAPEESEEGQDQRLPGVGTTDFKEGELVLMPCPNEEEVENAAVSSKKRKAHGKRRCLRLWFES